MAVSTTLEDAKFKTEVRLSLGDISSSMITDDMIIHQKDRYVIPFLEDREETISGSDDDIDNAIIALTAKKAFGTWMKKRQMTAGDMNVSIDTKQYAEDLKEQANDALQRIGVDYRPETGPTAFVDSTSGFYDSA